MKRRLRPWYLTPEAGIFWLGGIGLLLVAAGLAGIIQIVQAATTPPIEPAAVVSVWSAPTLTPTPFQPQEPTRTALPTRTATPKPTSPPARHFAAQLLEESGSQASLEIDPPAAVNQGKSIQVNFLPGSECTFGSGTACLSRHQRGDLLLLTIHSGLGGQAESFRRAVEGIGIDSALYSLARIHANLDALQGAPARLTVGSYMLDNLELVGVARIPPERLQEYFDLPGDAALDLAGEYNPAVKAALASGEELLAFEVCGWSVPGEPWAPGTSATTASIYIGFIRDH
jgi:hypothetical protein